MALSRNRSTVGSWAAPGGSWALVLLAAILALALAGTLVKTAGGSGSSHAGQVIQDGPLCDFGANASHAITSYDTSPLRLGWYIDYAASSSPAEPNGADYAPVIRIHQDGPAADDYSYTPNGSALEASIAGNPGAVWFISNEPDRRFLQDDLEPHVYAASYHELYHLIKATDPTARIFAGSIVQPSPIRLQYLDRVLDSYLESYGVPMPVDGWSIHNFILNEVSCDYFPQNCWGAEVPPGIDAPYGEILGIEDNDSFPLLVERIQRFRLWMAARGYRDVPLYLSEYGILMPEDLGSGFPPSRVNDYMNNTFDYLLTAINPQYGFPHDENRLVQKLSWYSTSDGFYNGWLFELIAPATYALSPMGQNYAAFVAGIESEVDLFPSRISVDPPAPLSPTEPVTLTITAAIANSGNNNTAVGPAAVRFYDGPPGGGSQIGGNQFVSLRGCGDFQAVSVTWPNVPPGVHRVYVVVDPQVGELDTANNTASRIVLIASNQVFLPYNSKTP